MPVRVAIVYPSDPLGGKVGGPETFLKGFIKFAPDDFSVDYYGISTDRGTSAPGRWKDCRYGRRPFRFYPLFVEADENKKTLVPLSFRFTARLFFSKLDVKGKILLFDRIEPALPFHWTAVPQIGVIHNDLDRWLKKGQSEVVWSRVPAFYFMLERFIFRSFDKIYSVNEKTLKLYGTRYRNLKERFAFLPTWVDQEIFYPEAHDKKTAREALNRELGVSLPPGKRWVLFVGRFQEQKAPLRLVESFARYAKEDPEARLLLVGEGNLKEKVRGRAQDLGIAERSHFLGNQTQERLARIYRAADLLLLTSNFEGMPRCVLEALGSGIPVVTTRVGEAPLVVRPGVSGEIVDSFEAGDIARAIGGVAKNPARYGSKHCVQSIEAYVPQKVLAPLYRSMRELNGAYPAT